MPGAIPTNILRLISLKEDIVSTMEDIGIMVPDGAKYDALPSLIDSFVPASEADLVSIIDKTVVNLELSETLKYIGNFAFFNCSNLALTSLPSGLTGIDNNAFAYCGSLTNITFQGTPTSIQSTIFYNCTNLTIINVPWSSGAVANAPWGATNATINYNYV